MKTIIIFLTIALAGCSTQKPLHKTDHYVITTAVKENTGTRVTFQNVKGSYLLLSDTLKVKDTVKINVITVKSKN